MKALTVVIQAGGESKRMGRPKATVSFCGAPLICRGLKRLGHIADELIITSNDKDSLGFLCSGVTLDKLRLVSDLYEKRSALNGLYTALLAASNPYVAVVACDMIFASAPLLTAEYEALELSGADAAVPRTSHGYEPFHAVYRRETCLPLIKAALDQGQTKATVWFEKAKLIEFTPAMVLHADPRGGSFVNVNTPQELADMEQRILNETMTKIANLPEDMGGQTIDCDNNSECHQQILVVDEGHIRNNMLISHHTSCDLSCGHTQHLQPQSVALQR